MELRLYVGGQIRRLREEWNSGRGLSQDQLAKRVKTTANTVSRWETGTYRPSVEELDKLARVFCVSIATFFPDDLAPQEGPLTALLRAAKDLEKNDLEELRRFAEFRLYSKVQNELPARRRRESVME